ncbi:MAG: alpha/beta hydrolase [bacterium]
MGKPGFLTVMSVCCLILFPAWNLFSQNVSLPFPNSRFDTVEGIQVHYRIWNEQVDRPKGKILFVHGFAGSTFCFRNLYDTLAMLGYKIVAVDLPGAGYSSRVMEFNQSHSNRARFLWKFLNGFEPADTSGWILVGHSMGGGTAEAMAIISPERTRKLIIVAGTVFKKDNNMTGTVGFMFKQKKVKKMMIRYADRKLITYKKFNRLLKSVYSRKPDSTEVLGYLKPLELEGSSEAVINVFVNNKEIRDLDVRTLTGVPVLAIWGTKDNWVSLNTTRLTLAAFPDLKLVKIKGAGHSPMETHPEQFIPPFLEFISHPEKQPIFQNLKISSPVR